MQNGISHIITTDLDWWSEIKRRLNERESKILFKQGEIWWCNVGLNLGEEIFGKGINLTRPVLVFRKLTHNSFMALPLTTKEKKGTWYVEISFGREKRWIMLNQARIMDKKRLTKRMRVLDDIQFLMVKEQFLNFYSS